MLYPAGMNIINCMISFIELKILAKKFEILVKIDAAV
jgi:hypothetical protein